MVGLLLIAAIVTPCLGDRMTPSAASRTAMLREAVETSQYVVIATVTGQTGFQHGRWVYTRNDLKVRQFIKGYPTADSLLAVATGGGSVAGRHQLWSESYSMSTDSTYLLFLAQCPDFPVLLPIDDVANALLRGDLAIHWFDYHPVPAAALLDSVGDMARSADRRSNFSAADGVVQAHIYRLTDDYPGTPRYQNGGWLAMTIGSIYKGAEQLRLAPGDTMSVRYQQSIWGDVPDSGPVPALSVGDEAVFFLRHATGQWSLLPTVYSRWRVAGDSAYVESQPACCRGASVVVQTLPWPSAMNELVR